MNCDEIRDKLLQAAEILAGIPRVSISITGIEDDPWDAIDAVQAIEGSEPVRSTLYEHPDQPPYVIVSVDARVAEVATAMMRSAPRERAISANFAHTRLARRIASGCSRFLRNSPSPRRTVSFCSVYTANE